MQYAWNSASTVPMLHVVSRSTLKLNMEQRALRTAVIQHRTVLDILTAKQGGVCKMIGTTCCFFVPDNHDNVTDVITAMSNAIRDPPAVSNPLEWLSTLGGGWVQVVMSLLMPIVIPVLLILCVGLPLVKRMVSAMMVRIAGTYVHIDSEDANVIRMKEMPDV